MHKRERIQTAILYGVFICYIILLMKILFFSRVSLTDLFNSHRIFVRSINLVPFDSILDFVSGSSANGSRFAFANVGGNILMFMPLGVFLSVLRKDSSVLHHLSLICGASVFVELVQGLYGIGTADIDDIILNCVGGWIGILLYKTLRFVLRDEKIVRIAITVLSVIVGLPVIYYYLFLIRMRF